jgi:hypothetical protein
VPLKFSPQTYGPDLRTVYGRGRNERIVTLYEPGKKCVQSDPIDVDPKMRLRPGPSNSEEKDDVGESEKGIWIIVCLTNFTRASQI